MPLPSISIPKLSEHGGELFLLGCIGLGVLALLGVVLLQGHAEGASVKESLVDVSPFLLIEQSIIGAVKDRWNARLQGQSNQLLGAATPGAQPSANDNVQNAKESAA